jgi:hypothetical protein
MKLDHDRIRVGLTPAKPTLEMHEALVLCARDRARRARVKRETAEAEEAAAVEAEANEIAARDAFIAANPDPQLMML